MVTMHAHPRQTDEHHGNSVIIRSVKASRANNDDNDISQPWMYLTKTDLLQTSAL